jgi:hypothetical protein
LIPQKIVRFLEQTASVAFAGTRDGDLVPFGHRVSGWRLGADQRTMTIEAFPVHETYQFKGRFLRHRAAHLDDVEAVDRIRQRLVKNMKTIPYGPPEDALKAFVSSPALAVDFEVLEVYLQTPGPGAGTRLVPPVEQ